jgi:hypothetical protein
VAHAAADVLDPQIAELLPYDEAWLWGMVDLTQCGAA